MTKELCYVKNDKGQYETGLSTGWDVKSTALESALDDINEQLEEARQLVKNGEKSPIYYFMKKNIMDLALLASHVSFWKLTIKRHMKPSVFSKLNDKQLQQYADAFNISIDELKTFKG